MERIVIGVLLACFLGGAAFFIAQTIIEEIRNHVRDLR